MNEWIETKLGYLKLDAQGNVLKKHPYKYCSAGNKNFKIKINPDGSEGEVDEVENHCYIYVHPVTGEIIGSSGLAFYLQYELDGIIPNSIECKDGQKAQRIKISASKLCRGCGKVENLPLEEVLPQDFIQDDKINYAWNAANKKLVKR